jgi:fumarate reductase flavoprotein subunit
MNNKKSLKAETLQSDIIVVGGGGSGMAAALAAAENGVKRITVLEARRVAGGNAVFPTGIFAAESSIQKRQGIHAAQDDIFKKAMEYSHWKTNPRLIRALINKSGDTIHWLEEKGVKFKEVIPVYPNESPFTFHISHGPKKTGASVVEALEKSCINLGVQFFFETTARKLITSRIGSVKGVLADTITNKVKITAKSIILATGGFTANMELLKKSVPLYDHQEIYYPGMPRMGDGVLLAEKIGAATEGMTVLEIMGPAFPWSNSVSLLTRAPETIWLNKRGERFADETVTFLFSEAANCIYRQPGKVSYTIFDENIKQDIVQKMLRRHKPGANGVNDELRSQAGKGRVKISDSWEEIADWLGASPEVLKSTINEYNSFCEQGYDNDFVKDQRYLFPLRTPPYYAVQSCLDCAATHGGIKVNQRMEVLNHQDNPIPGLYASGVEIGGTESDTYNAGLPGHSFGFTISSGRIAGENAAQYVISNEKV